MNVVRAVPVLALGLVACGDSTPITLHYHPKPGSTFRYVMNQDLTMQPEGGQQGVTPQQLTVRIAFTQTVKGPAEGGIAIAVRVDSVTMTSPGLPAEAVSQATAMLRGLESRLVFDEHMKVLSSAVSDAAGVPPQLANQIASGLRGASFPLPDRPLKVGESWSVEMAAPTGLPGMSQPLQLHYEITLKDVTVTGADTVVRLGIETTFPKDPINVSGPDGNGTVTMDGRMKGDQEFSLTRGTIVRVDLSGSMKVTTAGGVGVGAMKMEQRLGLELLGSQTAP